MTSTAALRLSDSVTGETVGTGVLIGRPPMLLTCCHVIEAVEALKAYTAEGDLLGSIPSSAFQRDRSTDLAVASPNWPDMPPAQAIQFAHGDAVSWSGFPYADLGVHGVIAGDGRIATRTRAQIGPDVVPALQLLGSPPLSPGMSGGPLIDEASGAVVGLTAAEFREVVDDHVSRAPGFAGFAVPLPRDGSLLSEALRDAEAAVARFGSTPNAAGAATLISDSAAQAQAFAERMLDYAPDRTVDRHQLAEQVDAFLSGEHLIMPVVGESGVGKTTFLQNLLRRAERPCLLVRCAALEPGRDIEAVLAAALGFDQVRSPARQSATLSTIAHAVGSGVLLLDGLNELRIEVDWEGRRFSKGLVHLLRSIGWKAIVTSRPGPWSDAQAAFDPETLHLVRPEADEGDDRRQGPIPTRLGDFLSEELLAFLEKNHGPSSLERVGVRNPLTLALALRDGSNAATALDLDNLLELQLDHSLRRLVRDRPAGGVARQMIRAFCVGLAKQLLMSSRSDFSLEDVAEDHVVHLEGLVAETILVPTAADRWRFRYDQMLEHLQASAIADPAAVFADPGRRDPALGRIPEPVLSVALRRMSSGPDREPVHRVLRFGVEQGAFSLAMALGALKLNDDDLTVVHELLDLYRERDPEGLADAMLHNGFVDPPWQSIRVGFAILRAFVMSTDGYGWRTKDVSMGNYAAMNTGILEFAGIDGFIDRALAQDRMLTLSILAGWLRDDTRMHGSEGHVSTFTLNLLHALRKSIGTSTVVALVAESGRRDQSFSIAQAFARDELRDALAALEDAANEGRASRWFLLDWIRAFAQRSDAETRSSEIGERLGALLISLAGRDAGLETERLLLLTALPAFREEAWRQYADAFRAGRVGPSPLRTYILDKPDEVMKLVSLVSATVGDPDQLASIISEACPRLRADTDDDVLRLWRRWIELVAELLPRSTDCLKHPIERLLCATDLEAARRIGLIDLTLAAVQRGDASFNSNLRYAIGGRTENSFGDRESLERHLCERIVDDGPPEAAAAVVEGLTDMVNRTRLFQDDPRPPARFIEFAKQMEKRARARGDVCFGT